MERTIITRKPGWSEDQMLRLSIGLRTFVRSFPRSPESLFIDGRFEKTRIAEVLGTEAFDHRIDPESEEE